MQKRLIFLFWILLYSSLETYGQIGFYALQHNSFGFTSKPTGYFKSTKDPFGYTFGLSAGIRADIFNIGPFWQVSPTGLSQRYFVVSEINGNTLASESFYARSLGVLIECNPSDFVLGLRLGSLKSVRATFLGENSEIFQTYTFDRAFFLNPYIGFEVELAEDSDFWLRVTADFQYYKLKNREVDGFLFEEKASGRVAQNTYYYGLNIGVKWLLVDEK